LKPNKSLIKIKKELRGREPIVRKIANVLLIFHFFSFLSCRTGEPKAPTFDGDKAYQYLIRQCDFGPRVPGSQAHQRCLNFLTSELKKFDATVTPQPFRQKLPGFENPVTMTNIIASFGLQKAERILLCAHWDSRPWADQDPDSENRDKPIIGANDGASGVAVLLEVARNLQSAEPKYGVDIILFDGEDSGLPGQADSYALGAQHFAKNKDFRYRPKFGILLDMIGDGDLQIYQEENSVNYAPKIVKRIWDRAEELGSASFHASSGYQVTDDHLPLLNVGIPCVNLIDFDYEYWHTLADTPDKCSPESLAEVGRVILSLLYE